MKSLSSCNQSGWLQMNNTLVPYIKSDYTGRRVVPIAVLTRAASLLWGYNLDHLIRAAGSEEVDQLNQLCTEAGVQFRFNLGEPLVKLKDLGMSLMVRSGLFYIKELPKTEPLKYAVYIRLVSSDEAAQQKLPATNSPNQDVGQYLPALSVCNDREITDSVNDTSYTYLGLQRTNIEDRPQQLRNISENPSHLNRQLITGNQTLTQTPGPNSDVQSFFESMERSGTDTSVFGHKFPYQFTQHESYDTTSLQRINHNGKSVSGTSTQTQLDERARRYNLHVQNDKNSTLWAEHLARVRSVIPHLGEAQSHSTTLLRTNAPRAPPPPYPSRRGTSHMDKHSTNQNNKHNNALSYKTHARSVRTGREQTQSHCGDALYTPLHSQAHTSNANQFSGSPNIHREVPETSPNSDHPHFETPETEVLPPVLHPAPSLGLYESYATRSDVRSKPSTIHYGNIQRLQHFCKNPINTNTEQILH